MENTPKNTRIFELRKKKLLSNRCYHICKYNNLLDTNAISDYYRQYGSFRGFRNCGENCNLELINICENFDEGFNPFENTGVINREQEINKIAFMDRYQRQILDNIIKFEANKLASRNIKALTSLVGGNIDVNNIETILNLRQFEIEALQFVGEKSVSGLNTFINNINQNIDSILSITDENRKTIDLFNSFSQIISTLKQDKRDKLVENQDFTHGLPIFKILKVLIDEEIFFEHYKNVVFKSCFNYYINTKISFLEEIGLTFNLKKRTLKKDRLQIYEGLLDTFSVLKRLKTGVSDLYRLDYSENFIKVDENLVSRINQVEESNFNNLFITKILSILYDDQYLLIGDEKTSVFGNSKLTSHNWVRLYLIKKHYAMLFDFVKLVENVRYRLSVIKKDYSINYTIYLLQFQLENCEVEIENIREIASYILLNEFELSTNTNGNLYFTKYTKRQVKGSVLCLFDIKSEHLTLKQIFELINNDIPGIVASRKQLSEIIQTFPEITFFESTKTYSLKSWDDSENSYGLTIKDLARQYLADKTEPTDLDEVIEYVKIHFNATGKDILSNLKFDPKKIFVFLRGKQIDLKAKEYVSFKYVKTRKLKLTEISWEDSYNKAKVFIQENNRLPISNGSQNEAEIYEFLRMQELLLTNGKLLPERIELFEKLGFQTRKLVQTKIWMDMYEKLKQYRELHKDQWPKLFYTSPSEKFLYMFCTKNRWRIGRGKLAKYKTQLLNDIDFHLFEP